MTRRRSGASQLGFTLVEALLALALMGVILTALATVTAQWLPNWNRGFARVQRVEHLALGIERLVADLAAAESIRPGRESVQPLFDGAQLSVTFVRTALGPNTRSGLEIVRIAEMAGERGPTLVRTRAPFMPIVAGVNDKNPPNFADPVVLMRAPYRVSFAYAGADRVWQDIWRGAYQLPAAIRVTVRDDATQRTLAISTATMVHVDLPAECISAKSMADCRSRKPAPPANPEGDKAREL